MVLAGLLPQALAQPLRPRLEPRDRLPGVSTGDPCGIVIEAEMTSASSAGTKRKPGRPDNTKPTGHDHDADADRGGQVAPAEGGVERWAVDALREALPIEERPVHRKTSMPGEVLSPTQPFPTKPAPFDYQGVAAHPAHRGP